MRPAGGSPAGVASALGILLCCLTAMPTLADEAASSGLSVSVTAARRICFTDTVEVTGSLFARREVDILPERDGYKVAQVFVAPLETVTAGQALASLSPMEGMPGSGSPSTIRAAVSGTILRSNAQPGAPASPRQGALFQIAAQGEIDLQAEVPLAGLAKLAVGQPVTVQPLGVQSVSGTVRRIDASLDPASQLGRVRIGLSASPGGSARVGTFARGMISLRERCGIGVPYSSVMYEADGTIVQTIEGDRIVTRQVSIGLLSGTDVEILVGLTEADKVVVRAGAFLRDGDQVYPITREAAGGR
ncbi:hypothetical protein ASF26_15510 [Methylobacterium sp. Leaf93]|nr:hypothetical protein ASF26_15510 [Methylobacterium sp. Leaf93]